MTNIKLGNKVIYYQVFYKNNKHMYMRIKHDLVTITCNHAITKHQIEAFIRKNETKILKVMEAKQEKTPLYSMVDMMLFGSSYALKINTKTKNNTYRIYDTYIEINTRKEALDSSMIESIYKAETIKAMQALIADDLQMVKAQIPLTNLTLKAQLMKSRYGSCIPKKRIIKLNSLARLPKVYLKTILIHELIHLKVHNHSKAFYAYMNQWIPTYKSLIRSLNQYARKVQIA